MTKSHEQLVKEAREQGKQDAKAGYDMFAFLPCTCEECADAYYEEFEKGKDDGTEPTD